MCPYFSILGESVSTCVNVSRDRCPICGDLDFLSGMSIEQFASALDYVEAVNGGHIPLARIITVDRHNVYCAAVVSYKVLRCCALGHYAPQSRRGRATFRV